MGDTYGLDRLSVGERAVICENGHFGGMRRRLSDMGFTVGTAVRCTGKSPCGGMKAYCVRGSVVALRTKDAERVYVTGIDGGGNAVW